MISHRLRELLKKPVPQRRRIGGVSSTCTLVVGKKMVADGCESTVCLASRIPGERRQRRVVLNSIAPGEVVRAPARFFDEIVDQRRLPRTADCWLWRGGRAWVRPRSPPCRHHADGQTCTRCPWMGLAATASREIKAEYLRRVVEPLFPSEKSLPAAHEEEELVKSTSTSPPSSLRFLEPFDIPIATHSMREVEFYFRQPSKAESVATSCTSTTTPPPAAAAAAALQGKFCISKHSVDVPECLLCTLEQQRLLSSMNRWAERLPLAVQECLCAVFVLQHTSHDGVARPWERALHLTLLLRKDTARFGEQSPLCGPLQPEELLSAEERQLVDAVLSAAPLTKHIGVATVCNDGSVNLLYPHPRRVDFSMASGVLEAEFVVSCTAMHYQTGKAVAATLPFMHSSVAFALGGRDMTALEFSSPSVWRLTMALEAVGSVLLSIVGDLQGDGAIMVLAEQTRHDGSLGAAVSRKSGSRLLADVLSQWLGQLSSSSSSSRKTPIVRVTSGERVDLGSRLHFEEGVNLPALWLCLLEADATVAAAAAAASAIVRHVMESIRKGSSAAKQRILLVQLATSGNFHPLASALCSVKSGLEQHFQLRLDSGVVDIDPWTAASVGYVALELSGPVTR